MAIHQLKVRQTQIKHKHNWFKIISIDINSQAESETRINKKWAKLNRSYKHNYWLAKNKARIDKPNWIRIASINNLQAKSEIGMNVK